MTVTARSNDSTRIERAAAMVHRLRWPDLRAELRARVPLLMLDAIGCARAGQRLGTYTAFTETLTAGGGPQEACVWGRSVRIPAAHAALVNGTVTHHVEMDDGHAEASLHGGVTVIPAVLAAAERDRCSGEAVLTAIVAGYSAAVACGHGLRDGIVRHRLHPPSMVGCFGAAAGVAKLQGLDAAAIGHALALAATLLPLGPFEAFTRGATVKDLYAGWPAYIGVMAAALARDGLSGPLDVLDASRDGLPRFLRHGRSTGGGAEADPEAILDVHFKAYATCRSVQPSLTALETVLPVAAADVERIEVETYPYAVELSRDSDPGTAIGAKTSIPYCVATYLIDGEVGPASFAPTLIRESARLALATRVDISVASDMSEPLVRGARVTLRLASGEVRRGATTAARWTAALPATIQEVRAKFRRLAGDAAAPIERAVDGLASAASLDELCRALQVRA